MIRLFNLTAIISVFVLGVCDPFIFKKAAFSQAEAGNGIISFERSPFALSNPKVPDRPVPFWMISLPPGYDRPQDVVNAGARWARYGGLEGLTWDLVENERGRYDWSRTDYMFSEAAKAGLNLVVVVMNWNHLDQPDVRAVNGGLSVKAPHDMAGFLNFLEKAVERYDGDGIDDALGSPVINYWEIENEVDFDIFWSDTPENYARLLKNCYKIIKKANPNAKVLIAGMSHQPDLEKSRSYYFSIIKELDRIKDNPDDKYFDIFSFHLYNLNQDINVIPTMDSHVNAIREGLSKYGYFVPFWLTETGDYSGSPLAPAGAPSTFKLFTKTENEQAASLFKIYVYSITHNVKKVFWLTLTEWSGYAGLKDNVFDNVGLINNPETDGQSHKKLSYYTYKNMVEILDGSDLDAIRVIQEKDGIYIYRFMKNGKPVWAAWNNNPQENQIVISGITSKQVKITEAVMRYGSGFKTKTENVSDGRISVSLGSIPVLIGDN
ncbi:MAG: hypothetical protein PHC71_03220 [Candidatus Omnitrophica bacterium]|nr:hypothetical protein [Candidatus Omnitrophota bacterium]